MADTGGGGGMVKKNPFFWYPFGLNFEFRHPGPERLTKIITTNVGWWQIQVFAGGGGGAASEIGLLKTSNSHKLKQFFLLGLGRI